MDESLETTERLRAVRARDRRVLGTVLIGLGLVFCQCFFVSVTEEVQRAIKPGMSRIEVERLIGAPPGNYSSIFLHHDCDLFMMVQGQAQRWKWVGPQGAIFVFVDANGRVITSVWVSLAYLANLE
ncbi:MAG: hypothetical protein AB7K24_11625 [Gemmataceae bacterium]